MQSSSTNDFIVTNDGQQIRNLAVCPAELLKLDPNAETLWKLLLKRSGVSVSKGEHIEDGRGWTVRNFGLPSLLQRLRPEMTERQRARVWWRECAACSEGESVPDLTAETLYNLNAWIASADQKYPRKPDKSATAKDTSLNAVSCGRDGHYVDGLIPDSPETPRESPENKALRGRPRISEEEKRRTAADRQARWREKRAAAREQLAA